jgi:hypothetical protein
MTTAAPDTWTHPCENIVPGDGLAHIQVVYCEAWEAYLCDGCRSQRNNDELRVKPACRTVNLPPETRLQL